MGPLSGLLRGEAGIQRLMNAQCVCITGRRIGPSESQIRGLCNGAQFSPLSRKQLKSGHRTMQL